MELSLIIFNRLRKFFQVIVLFLEAHFCQFSPTVLSALASLRSARAEMHSGLKLTKMCLQKRDNNLEKFPESVENDSSAAPCQQIYNTAKNSSIYFSLSTASTFIVQIKSRGNKKPSFHLLWLFSPFDHSVSYMLNQKEITNLFLLWSNVNCMVVVSYL